MPHRSKGAAAPVLRPVHHPASQQDTSPPALYVEPLDRPGLVLHADGSGYYLAPIRSEQVPKAPADVTPTLMLALTKERVARETATRTIQPRPQVKCVDVGDEVIVVARNAAGKRVEFRVPRAGYSRAAVEEDAAYLLARYSPSAPVTLRVVD